MTMIKGQKSLPFEKELKGYERRWQWRWHALAVPLRYELDGLDGLDGLDA